MSPALRRAAPALVAITAVALLAFGAVIPGGFVVDDNLWANAVPARIDSTMLMRAFAGWGFSDTALGQGITPIYRPLQTLLMKFAQLAFGANAGPFHVLSIAVHAANGMLLYRLLGSLFPALEIAPRLLCSLLFVAHPAGSEAVLWISAFSEITVTAFMLATLLLYLHWRTRPTAARLAALAALVFAACLFKETAIVLPLLIATYELTLVSTERRLSWRVLAAICLAPLAFLLLRHLVIGSLVGGQPLAFDPARVVELALAHFRFIWLPAAAPFALRPPEVALASPLVVSLSLLFAAGLGAACWRLRGGARSFAFAILWCALTLWPAYAVAAVGEGFFNARQAYLPTIGFALAGGALFVGLPERSRPTGTAAGALLIVWMIFATSVNALAWRSNIEVYRMSLQLSPKADGPRAGIAAELAARGDAAGAISMYSEALERAGSAKARGEYLYALASLLGQGGRNAESIRLLNELVALEPRNSAAWVGLGNNAWMLGRLDEAESYYQRAFDLDPENFEAASNLAGVLAAKGPANANEAGLWRSRASAIAARQARPSRR